MSDIKELVESSVNKTVNYVLENARQGLFSKIKKQQLTWHIIHLISYLYPDNPSDEERITFGDFYVMHIKDAIMSCGGCRNNYVEKIKAADFNEIFSSKESLIKYFIEMHNQVTTDKFKHQKDAQYKLYTFEEVLEFYKQNDFQQFFKDVYDFDILDLLYKKEYQLMVEKINKLT